MVTADVLTTVQLALLQKYPTSTSRVAVVCTGLTPSNEGFLNDFNHASVFAKNKFFGGPQTRIGHWVAYFFMPLTGHVYLRDSLSASQNWRSLGEQGALAFGNRMRHALLLSGRAQSVPNVQVVPVRGPQQQDGCSCGFFAVQALDVVLKHMNNPTAATNVDIPNVFRQAYETDHRGGAMAQIALYKAGLKTLVAEFMAPSL